jgi:FkbM family methyltransferase
MSSNDNNNNAVHTTTTTSARISIRSKRPVWTSLSITVLATVSVWSLFLIWSRSPTIVELSSSAAAGENRRAPSTSSSSTSTTTAVSFFPSDSSERQLKPSMWDAIAPVIFQMEENGFLSLSKRVRTLVIDVGARDSEYLRTLELTNDPSVGLILVDPFPDSAVPLQQRVSTYSMLQMSTDHQHRLHNRKSKQVYMVKAAFGAEEGIQNFNIASGPACGSLLKQSNASKFSCSKAKRKIQVAVLTLEGLIQRIPPFVDSFHLKVDAEGADLMVLQGAKETIRKFQTVIIECTDTDNNQTAIHEGECSLSAARQYMASYGFTTDWEEQGGLGNAYFLNQNITSPIPDFLIRLSGSHSEWYEEKAEQLVIASS